MNAATAFCFSLTSQLVLCLALLQWLSAQAEGTSSHPNLHPADQQTATYQQPANRQPNGLLWEAISESSRPAFSDDQPTSVLPFLSFGNLSPWRSPLKMWSRSLCRSQSPGSPTPGSPFIFLFIPSHHPAPNCHLCVIVSSPTCRSQWKGWRWAPEWWRDPLKAGWATNRPERMSATWTFNCFHENFHEKNGHDGVWRFMVMMMMMMMMMMIIVMMLRPSSIRTPSFRSRSRSIRPRSSRIWRVKKIDQHRIISSSLLRTDSYSDVWKLLLLNHHCL